MVSQIHLSNGEKIEVRHFQSVEAFCDWLWSQRQNTPFELLTPEAFLTTGKPPNSSVIVKQSRYRRVRETIGILSELRWMKTAAEEGMETYVETIQETILPPVQSDTLKLVAESYITQQFFTDPEMGFANVIAWQTKICGGNVPELDGPRLYSRAIDARVLVDEPKRKLISENLLIMLRNFKLRDEHDSFCGLLGFDHKQAQKSWDKK